MKYETREYDEEAENFKYLVTSKMNASEKGWFVQFHDRVKFRLDAAKYFFTKLKELEMKAGSLVGPGINRNDVEFDLDAFLYEVVGAFEPLLQEINIAFKLNLELQNVEISTIITKLPTGSQVKNKLGRLDGDTEGWFWKLREYRNHSAHRKIIGFYLIKIMGGEETKVFLHKDPRNPEKGRADEEVLTYCQNSIKRMKELINENYKLCVRELTANTKESHLDL